MDALSDGALGSLGAGNTLVYLLQRYRWDNEDTVLLYLYFGSCGLNPLLKPQLIGFGTDSGGLSTEVSEKGSKKPQDLPGNTPPQAKVDFRFTNRTLSDDKASCDFDPGDRPVVCESPGHFWQWRQTFWVVLCPRFHSLDIS